MLRESTIEQAEKPETRIWGCRDEYENYQIVLVPGSWALKEVDLRFSDLLSTDGARIPSTQFEKYIIGYFKTRPPKYEVEYVGWWPDLLLPFWKCDVPKGKVQPVWFVLHIPPDAKSGVYRGTVEVAPAGLEPVRIPFYLTVWDFTMPRKSFLRTLNHAVRVKGKQRENLIRVCFEHRMGVDVLDFERGEIFRKWDFSIWDDYFQLAGERLTAFVLYSAWCSNNDPEKDKDFILALAKYLKDKGMYKYAVFYMTDEPQGSPRKMRKIKQEAIAMERILPDLPRLCTSHTVPELEPYVDIWAPHLGEYLSIESIREQKRKGKQCWWYTSTYPMHPMPNKFIDYPAIDHRIMWWITYKYEITGYLCTEIATWWGDKGRYLKTPYDYRSVLVPWDIHQSYYGHVNGNHDIVFPGPDDTILSSIRLELVRDGVEDYDMFTMLRLSAEKLQKAGKEKLAMDCYDTLALIDKAVQNASDWTEAPYELLEIRRRAGDQLDLAHRTLSAKR